MDILASYPPSARAREEEEESHSEQATDATHGRNGWLPLTAIEEAGRRLAGGRAHKLDLVRGFLGQRRRGAAISILNPRHYRGSLVRPSVRPSVLQVLLLWFARWRNLYTEGEIKVCLFC